MYTLTEIMQVPLPEITPKVGPFTKADPRSSVVAAIIQ